MTKTEAIETLKENLCGMCAYDSQCMESCDIRGCDNRDAIKALEQEPSCRNTRQVDLISRADLQELFNETTTSLMDKIDQKDIEHLVRACLMVTEMIQDAPSVVPKRGKWIDKGDFYVCSECGKRMAYAVLGPEFSRAYAFMSDYCPHCGSPMEVESDEE